MFPRRVSIPCWVFSPSRRDFICLGQQLSHRFQSRAGFSLRRDHTVSAGVLLLLWVSIPCWVFSPSRQDLDPLVGASLVVSIPCWVFSPSRPRSLPRRSPRRTVSIPCWVFSPSRRATAAPGFGRCSFNPVLGFLSVATDFDAIHEQRTPPFQSRAGFSLRRDDRPAACSAHSQTFQSRAGFSLRRDRR